MICDRCLSDPCTCVEDFNTLAADEDASYTWYEDVLPALLEDTKARSDEFDEFFELARRDR